MYPNEKECHDMSQKKLRDEVEMSCVNFVLNKTNEQTLTPSARRAAAC